MVGMQAEFRDLIQGVDMDGNQTLDYREFLAATMEKVLLHFTARYYCTVLYGTV